MSSILEVSVCLIITKIIIRPIRCWKITLHTSNRCRYRLSIGKVTSYQSCLIGTRRHIIACKLHKRSSSIFVTLCDCEFSSSSIACWVLSKLYSVRLTCLSILYLETQLPCRDTIKRIVRRLEVQRFITSCTLLYSHFHPCTFTGSSSISLCHIVVSNSKNSIGCQRCPSCS